MFVSGCVWSLKCWNEAERRSACASGAHHCNYAQTSDPQTHLSLAHHVSRLIESVSQRDSTGCIQPSGRQFHSIYLYLMLKVHTVYSISTLSTPPMEHGQWTHLPASVRELLAVHRENLQSNKSLLSLLHVLLFGQIWIYGSLWMKL